MKKGTRIALIALAVLAIVFCAGLWSLVSNAQKQLAAARDSSIVAGNETIALLAGSWDYSIVQLRLAPEFDKRYSEQEARAQFEEWEQTYGELVQSDVQLVGFQPGGESLGEPVLTAEFTCEAVFEKGKADVKMTLLRRPKNSWQLSAFEIGPLK